MKRTQLYLDDDMANILSALSRQQGTTISSLVRECIREKFGPRQQVDKAALAREIGGIWKKRKDLGATAQHVRTLRKGARLKNIDG
jgi:predicted DNA-binding protein